MGNTLSKPYLKLFSEAKNLFDLDTMEKLLKELYEETGVQDPLSQEDEQAKEKASIQAAINMGKAIAEKQNAISQGMDRSGVRGKKI